MNEYSTTIGIDLGDSHHYFCVLDRSGEVEQTGRVACNERDLERVFRGFEPSLIAMEAGTHSPWVSRLLDSMGHEVKVGNPRRLRAIYTHERKNDMRDAEMLARIARADVKLLSPISHRGAQAQAHLAIVRARASAVESRTSLVNHVRGAVKACGERLPSTSTPAFHNKIRTAIPPALRAALYPLVDLIEQLTTTIKEYDHDIEKRCSETYPETELLRQVSGVGPLTALTYVLTLEDSGRFKKSRDVPAYLGLTPRRSQSGDSDPGLPISKCGNTYLRKLLVGCAHYILGHHGPDTALRRWGERLVERGGKYAKQRAVVAVARKLAVLLHCLWATGMVYEPFPNAPENAL